MGVEEAHNRQHETVPQNIIFIADGQSYNLLNLDESGRLGGVIENPVVNVVTTENVSIPQIPSYVTSKAYLIEVNSDEALKNVEQIMEETGLDDFVMKFSPTRDRYDAELKELVIVILLQLVIAIVIQCVMYMLEKRLFVTMDKSNAFKSIVVSWCIAVCLALFIFRHINAGLVLSMIGLLIIDALIIKGKISFLNSLRM